MMGLKIIFVITYFDKRLADRTIFFQNGRRDPMKSRGTSAAKKSLQLA